MRAALGQAAVIGLLLAGTASADPLQSALDEWASVPQHRGVSAAVVFSDGRLWQGAAGRGDAEEDLRSDHLIAIASITKTMVGAVILQLAAESRLSLDQPISKWLPLREHVDPKITVRQLLNHTNGLDNYTTTAGLSAALAAQPDHVFTRGELLGFIGPSAFGPGEKTRYTNTAFLLLSEIAEKATGKPILELLRQRLWKPLKLRETFLPFAEPPPGPVATALAASGLVQPLDRRAQLSAGNTAFGLMASARDVARWGAALFRGRVVTPRLQREMRRLVPAAGNIPGESGVGLGIRGYGYLGRTQYGHSGGSPFGSSLLLFDPASRVTVVVLINQGSGADHFALAPALLEIATRK